MGKKKIKALAALSVTGLLGLGALGGTLAYLTDTDTAANEFTAGKVRLHMDGEDWSQTLVPGKTYDLKRNIVMEQGSEKAFVRVIARIKKGAVLDQMLRDADPDIATKNVGLYDYLGWDSSLWNLDQGVYGGMKRTVRDGDDITYVFYYQAYNPTKPGREGEGRSMNKPTMRAEDGDIEPGSLFGEFTVPTVWDNEDVEKLEGLSISLEVQAIQAYGTTISPSALPDWSNVSRAWDFWKEQNGIDPALAA